MDYVYGDMGIKIDTNANTASLYSLTNKKPTFIQGSTIALPDGEPTHYAVKLSSLKWWKNSNQYMLPVDGTEGIREIKRWLISKLTNHRKSCKW